MNFSFRLFVHWTISLDPSIIHDKYKFFRFVNIQVVNGIKGEIKKGERGENETTRHKKLLGYVLYSIQNKFSTLNFQFELKIDCEYGGDVSSGLMFIIMMPVRSVPQHFLQVNRPGRSEGTKP